MEGEEQTHLSLQELPGRGNLEQSCHAHQRNNSKQELATSGQRVQPGGDTYLPRLATQPKRLGGILTSQELLPQPHPLDPPTNWIHKNQLRWSFKRQPWTGRLWSGNQELHRGNPNFECGIFRRDYKQCCGTDRPTTGTPTSYCPNQSQNHSGTPDGVTRVESEGRGEEVREAIYIGPHHTLREL
jgi:hypothetical protein